MEGISISQMAYCESYNKYSKLLRILQKQVPKEERNEGEERKKEKKRNEKEKSNIIK